MLRVSNMLCSPYFFKLVGVKKRVSSRAQGKEAGRLGIAMLHYSDWVHTRVRTR